MGLNTELGERKLTILKAIIQNYLETGEPVGSRTLSKYTDLCSFYREPMKKNSRI